MDVRAVQACSVRLIGMQDSQQNSAQPLCYRCTVQPFERRVARAARAFKLVDDAFSSTPLIVFQTTVIEATLYTTSSAH